MKERSIRRRLTYVGVVVLGLILILFVGREVNPETGHKQLAFVNDGVNHFRKGLDVAGGTKLVYTIDYDKYKEIYTDQLAFQEVKKRIEEIIKRNIDGRVSKLGVSDYTSYYQTVGDKHYLIVEIGGIADLDQAKETIGKTLELEFKLPSEEEPTAQAKAERKALASKVLQEVLDQPALFQELTEARGSDNIFYGNYSGVTLAQLPLIYVDNAQILDTLEVGKVYPGLLDGTYAIIEGQDPEDPSSATELKGYTFFRVIDKKTVEKTDVYPQDIIALSEQYGLAQNIEFSSEVPSLEIGKYAYDAAKQTVSYYAANIAEGQEAFKVKIYDIPKASLLGMADEDVAAAEAEFATLVETAESVEDPATVAGVSLLMDDWTDLSHMQESIPEFTGQNIGEKKTYITANGAWIVEVVQAKAADDVLAQLIILEGVDKATWDKIEADFKASKIYSIEDVFVQDRQMWVPAVDSKTNEILNGAYFEFANTDISQVGEPIVSINFDEKGKDIFCNITKENIGTPMAIFAGGNMLTSPVIQDKICGGTAQINGGFTSETSRELAEALNEWTMPATLILMQEEKISPTLGENALRGSIIAGVVGIVVIILLMWFMYGWRKALVTAGVLVTFMIALLGFMKLTDYALSLSGIAAIILSIGMGVDANILIFERVREEVKAGRSIKSAIETGYKRSRAPIRDGNFSTAIIAALLFILGINMFKGFGLMMLINVVLILALNVPLTKDLLAAAFHRKTDYMKKSPMEKEIK